MSVVANIWQKLLFDLEKINFRNRLDGLDSFFPYIKSSFEITLLYLLRFSLVKVVWCSETVKCDKHKTRFMALLTFFILKISHTDMTFIWNIVQL